MRGIISVFVMLGMCVNMLFAQQEMICSPPPESHEEIYCCQLESSEAAYARGTSPAMWWTGVGLLLGAVGGVVAIIVTHSTSSSSAH